MSSAHPHPVSGPLFDADLIRRYDQFGPRYTSYPTAMQFHGDFDAADYDECARLTNDDPIPSPLSLYLHIPFCPTICFYCACTKIVTRNRAHADAYLRRLAREIEMQSGLYDADRVVEQIHWGGGSPTFLDREQMTGLWRVIRRHFPLPGDAEGEFSIEVDPRGVEVDDIPFLRQLGFNRISLGVQDLDARVQQAVNRVQPLEQTLAVVQASRNSGFRSISMDLIYGLPHQTVESIEKTLALVVAAGPDRLSVFNYAHLPRLFKAQQKINVEDLPSAEEKLHILELAIGYLTAAGYEYIGMDHFARPEDELCRARRDGTLSRSFQGYSTRGNCDLIGIGLSSIGRVGDCYSQNAKTMERYSREVDAGNLPVERGIRLTADDRLRRDVINELICYFSVDIRRLESKYNFSFRDYFRSEMEMLRQFEDDGLLGVADDVITVHPRGRFLIRNICMAFDRYLQELAQPGQFSRVL